MENHSTVRFDAYRNLDTTALRERFLLRNLFRQGELQLVYTDLDRAIVGSAVPIDKELSLEAGDQLRAHYFCERRELGILNLGQRGTVNIDGTAYRMAPRACLYVGRGTEQISFSSDRSDAPAQYYLLSYPAHMRYPTMLRSLDEATKIKLGSPEQANERHLYQYIHEEGIRSCQLVMGFTEIQRGSVWNTMPPHTHARRSEIYCYFDIEEGHQVAHFMGEPQETRALWISEKQVALSPPWSMHCGAGTGAYAFVWGMGGENQRFDDMDGFPASKLR